VKIPNPPGLAACMINWRDTIIVFGGTDTPYKVQGYNVSSGMLKPFCAIVIIDLVTLMRSGVLLLFLV
jgi:hypothetical protein